MSLSLSRTRSLSLPFSRLCILIMCVCWYCYIISRQLLGSQRARLHESLSQHQRLLEELSLHVKGLQQELEDLLQENGVMYTESPPDSASTGAYRTLGKVIITEYE